MELPKTAGSRIEDEASGGVELCIHVRCEHLDGSSVSSVTLTVQGEVACLSLPPEGYDKRWMTPRRSKTRGSFLLVSGNIARATLGSERHYGRGTTRLRRPTNYFSAI